MHSHELFDSSDTPFVAPSQVLDVQVTLSTGQSNYIAKTERYRICEEHA